MLSLSSVRVFRCHTRLNVARLPTRSSVQWASKPPSSLTSPTPGHLTALTPSRDPFYRLLSRKTPSTALKPIVVARRSYAYQLIRPFQRGGGGLNLDPTRWVIFLIIAINVVVFLVWEFLGTTTWGTRFMTDNFTLSVKNISEGRVWTFLTSMFSHKSFFHLLGNSVALYFIGSTMVPFGFLTLFFGGGLMAGLATLLEQQYKSSKVSSPYLKQRIESIPTLGSSGGMAAVLVGFGTLFPNQSIMIFPIPIPLPAFGLIGAFMLYSLSQLGKPSTISHSGHLGGGLFGALWYLARAL